MCIRDSIAYCLRVLTDYLDLLHDWQERYKPASPEEPLDERFVEALHMTVTFSITMLIAMRLFDSTVSSVKEKELSLMHICGCR